MTYLASVCAPVSSSLFHLSIIYSFITGSHGLETKVKGGEKQGFTSYFHFTAMIRRYLHSIGPCPWAAEMHLGCSCPYIFFLVQGSREEQLISYYDCCTPALLCITLGCFLTILSTFLYNLVNVTLQSVLVTIQIVLVPI